MRPLPSAQTYIWSIWLVGYASEHVNWTKLEQSFDLFCAIDATFQISHPKQFDSALPWHSHAHRHTQDKSWQSVLILARDRSCAARLRRNWSKYPIMNRIESQSARHSRQASAYLTYCSEIPCPFGLLASIIWLIFCLPLTVFSQQQLCSRVDCK